MLKDFLSRFHNDLSEFSHRLTAFSVPFSDRFWRLNDQFWELSVELEQQKALRDVKRRDIPELKKPKKSAGVVLFNSLVLILNAPRSLYRFVYRKLDALDYKLTKKRIQRIIDKCDGDMDYARLVAVPRAYYDSLGWRLKYRIDSHKLRFQELKESVALFKYNHRQFVQKVEKLVTGFFGHRDFEFKTSSPHEWCGLVLQSESFSQLATAAEQDNIVTESFDCIGQDRFEAVKGLSVLVRLRLGWLHEKVDRSVADAWAWVALHWEQFKLLCKDVVAFVSLFLETKPWKSALVVVHKKLLTKWHIKVSGDWHFDEGLSRKTAILLMCFLSSFSIVAIKMESIDKEKEEYVRGQTPVITERGAMAWVSAFTKRDFITCDSLVSNQDYRFYSPLVLTHSREDKYYTKALEGVVNCVTSIGLLSVDNSEYKFCVKLREYSPVDAVDTTAVEKLRDDYLTGTVSDSELNTRLSDIYFEAFSDSCFRLSSDTSEFIIVLSEVDDNGISYVAGTADLVDLIYQESGLSANFALYESTFKKEVDSIFKEGFN